MGLSQANSERGFGRVYKQPCRRFSLSDLKLATDDFKKEYFIGRGGFGRVYKGQIDNRTTTVAIKRLHLELESGQGGNEFWTEVKMLSELRHEHLVSLIGYCNEEREMILVYEYMARGTLEDYLCKITKTGNSPLSWELRLKVCIGAASGLNSLHTHIPKVIHRDVKSSNILLDENWLAKISDFGLSKMGPASESFTHLTTNVKGTFGYLDPQYFSTGRLTIKSDVYAFGVVLFEVLCGRAAVDWKRGEVERSLAIWACKCVRQGKVDQIIDSNLKEQILPACLNAYVEVATKCLHKDPHKRPRMDEIIKKLKFTLTLQQNGVSPSSSGWWFIRCFKFQKADKSKSMVRKEAIHLIDMVAEVEACLEQQEAERSGVIRWFEGDYSFDLEDLLRASAEVLGKGTVGTSYKVMLEEGITMVVKRLKNVGVTKKQFEQQMEVLGKMKHENVVPVKAFYCSKDESFLVYDYMRTGSLSTSLHGDKGSDSHSPLAWHNRMRIALSTARGLAHLHVSGQVVHGNIKSSNVLIRQGNYEASISDFGLNALFGKSTSTSYHVAGYSAPEVLETKEVTFKSDVYSFGVLLLELLTGKAPNQASLGEEHTSLPRWVQSVISKEWTSDVLDVELLRYNNAMEEMVQLMRIGMDCVVLVPHLRPAMPEVVRWIEEINGGKTTNSLVRQPSW